MRTLALLSVLFLPCPSVCLALTLERTVTFDSSDLTFEQENGYDMVSLEGLFWNVEETGKPRLPNQHLNLIGPIDTKVEKIEVLNSGSQLLGAHLILPVQSAGGTGLDPAPEWVPPDSAIYDSDQPYPGELVEVEHEGYLDQAHLVRIVVYPLQWTPRSGELRFYQSISFRLTFVSDSASSRLPVANRTVSAQAVYDLALRRVVSNPEDIRGWYDKPPLSLQQLPRPDPDTLWSPQYLIITNQAMAPAFDPLKLWKKKRGIPTETKKVEEILQESSGRDDCEKIRNYLIQSYESFGTLWVFLGGDNEIIPWRYMWNDVPHNVPACDTTDSLWCDEVPPSDLYYSDLTGNWDVDQDGRFGERHASEGDFYPEVIVGRVPSRSRQEAGNYVNKVLCYEQSPDTSYLLHHLALEQDQMQESDSAVGQAERVCASFPPHVTHHIWRETPSYDSLCCYFPTGEDFIDSVGACGYGMVTLYDHGGSWGQRTWSPGINTCYPQWTPCIWEDPCSGEIRTTWGSFYSVEDSTVLIRGDTVYTCIDGNGLENLTNAGAYSLVYSIGCQAAGLDNPHLPVNTACEGFLTCFPQRGAIAFLGNTREGRTQYSYDLHRKFVGCLFDTSQGFHVGLAEAISRSEYFDRYLVLSHNVFADPELPIWIQMPRSCEVSHPLQIPPDTASAIAVTVREKDAPSLPVDCAQVCLYKPGEFWLYAETDTLGEAHFSICPDREGLVYVTVSKPPLVLPSQTRIRVLACRGDEILMERGNSRPPLDRTPQ